MYYYDKSTDFGFVPSEGVKELWGVEMDLARKLKEVCEKHGLTYWMSDGTLLGAVRHKGFIPWDDDMDFTMPRKDYDKLLKVAKEEFQYPYFLQTTYSDPYYFSGYAQLRRSDTTAMPLYEVTGRHNAGVFIDIFVLDGWVENPVLRFLHRTVNIMIRKPMRRYKGRYGSNRICIALFRFLEAWFRMVKGTKHAGAIAYKYRHRMRMDKDIFAGSVMMEYAGEMFPVPIGWKKYLETMYGDYMTPVRGAAAHGELYVDLEHSSKETREMLKAHPELFEQRLKETYGY